MTRAWVWFMIGVSTAVMVHFTLYRMGLPMKPFIYQAF